MSEETFDRLQQAIMLDNLEKAFTCAAQIRSSLYGILANYKSKTDQYNNGILTEADYTVAVTKHRSNLLFFIKQMTRKEQEQLLSCMETTNSILFIESSPKDAPALQTGFEYKEVREAIRLGAFANRYQLQDLLLAATAAEMVNALIAQMPRYVHFSGHAGAGGVLLNNDRNEAEVLYTATLAEVLKKITTLYDQQDREIDLIFLNACRSEKALETISPYSLYCIGMDDYVADEAALSFSRQFYSTLANMEKPDIEACFRLSQILWNQQPRQTNATPQIWKKGQKMA